MCSPASGRRGSLLLVCVLARVGLSVFWILSVLRGMRSSLVVLSLEFSPAQNVLYFPNSWSDRSHLSASVRMCPAACGFSCERIAEPALLDFAVERTELTASHLCPPPTCWAVGPWSPLPSWSLSGTPAAARTPVRPGTAHFCRVCPRSSSCVCCRHSLGGWRVSTRRTRNLGLVRWQFCSLVPTSLDLKTLPETNRRRLVTEIIFI